MSFSSERKAADEWLRHAPEGRIREYIVAPDTFKIRRREFDKPMQKEGAVCAITETKN